MKELLLSAENAIAGRIASVAAKELLKGAQVTIVNAEKALISGSPRYTIRVFQEKRERGDPYAGPFYPTMPERMLRRMVRGMMPYKKPMGKRAFRRLRVHQGLPEELQGRAAATFPAAPAKAISLERLAQELRQRRRV